MKILFWNIRGLGNAGRRRQLVELCKKHDFHFICLQETIKETFRSRELNSFSRGLDFHWSWIPSNGHYGGLLMGADQNLVTILNEVKGEFCHYLDLQNVTDDFTWRLVNVYGPVQEDKKSSFFAGSKRDCHSVLFL